MKFLHKRSNEQSFENAICHMPRRNVQKSRNYSILKNYILLTQTMSLALALRISGIGFKQYKVKSNFYRAKGIHTVLLFAENMISRKKCLPFSMIKRKRTM